MHAPLPPPSLRSPGSADTCIQEIISSWDLRESEHRCRGDGPLPVVLPPRPACHLPGLQLQGALLPGHQEGVWELGVRQLPHLLRNRMGAGQARPPPPGTVGWRLMDCAQGTLQAPGTRDGRRGLAHHFRIPRSQANAPAPASLYPSGADGPGVLAAAKLAQCEVGVTVPDTWVTRNKNWVTNWAWEHSFCKSRSGA